MASPRKNNRTVKRLNLAEVLSGTGKVSADGLEKIFRDAARSGTVIILDEADALFEKRTEIKDAHDRYAALDRILEKYPSSWRRPEK